MMIKSLLAPALLCFRSRKISPSTGVGFRVESGFGIRGMSASVGSSKPVTGQNEVGEVKLLDAVNDNYGGVVVEMKLPMESASFASLLRASLTQWRLQGKRGVWIKLPIEHVNLVEVAVKEGFWYHHAEPKYLMLAHWIPEIPSTLPANASHRVGVGAVVMNEKKEGDNILQSSGQTWELNHGKAMEMAHLTKAADAVLVVQENSGILHGTGLWKFPTGVVNEGEDICAAAVREVKEETAIDTKFVEVLAFRQSHKSFFEKSDLFFVCQLEPLSSDIQKQDSEIEVAQWMPLEEYAANPLVKKHELLKCIVDICYAKMEKDYSGFSPVSVSSAFSGEKKNFLYLNHRDLNRH